MKFVIKQDVLLEMLNHTSRAISPRNLIPILTGIKFELNNEGLFLSASDTDISIRCLIPIDKIEKVYESGSIVIGGKYIVDIVRKLPNVDITIEVLDGYKMIVSTDNTEFCLNGINPSEFPDLELESGDKSIVLNTSLFKEIVNQTVFATSQSESRPILTGINFEIKENVLEVIATDSYRLAKKSVVIDNDEYNGVNIVIPGKNLIELCKILDDDESDIELYVFENKVLFKYKNILFLSRLLSGNYPATASIIPDNFVVSVSCGCNNLYNMIDRASLLTSDRDKNIIKLSLADKNLVISSNSPEIGNVEENLSVDSSDEIVISFSSKYMLDAIKSFGTSEVCLYMNDDNSPIIIKSFEDESLIQLVLPIRTY